VGKKGERVGIRAMNRDFGGAKRARFKKSGEGEGQTGNSFKERSLRETKKIGSLPPSEGKYDMVSKGKLLSWIRGKNNNGVLLLVKEGGTYGDKRGRKGGGKTRPMLGEEGKGMTKIQGDQG